MRGSTKQKDATPIKEEDMEEEYSDIGEEEQYVNKRRDTSKDRNVTRQTTRGSKGDFERDSMGD
jgi:hypothetical protein